MAAIFDALTKMFNLLMDQFGTSVSTVMDNELLFVSVLVALGGGLISAGVGIMRKFGVRGFGSKKRRRR